ncbi:MAG: hypothetical protein HN341_18500 [Verrucomicrobia bacterium]|jgi:hypothetical protein|nr:hypothetical protein [Verrucomicrobiota bacterium]
MKLKHDSIRSVNVVGLACVVAACLLAVNASAQTTYTWTGTAGDGSWANTANWNSNGVPVDSSESSAGLSFANVGSKIIFSAATLPTNNVPDIGGTASGGIESPVIDLQSGGTLTLTAGVGMHNGFFSNAGGGRTLFVVGDGVSGAAEDVTLNLDVTGDLNRHSQAYHDFTVNSDGTLNFTKTSDQVCAYNTSRNVTFTIAGGAVSFAGSLSKFGAGYPNSFAEFTATGGTFTASYGGDYANITAVSNRLGYDFVSRSAGIAVEATDNTTTFTVTAVEFLGPTVTVEVPDAAAAEQGSDPGTIRISRGVETNGDMNVYYTLGGTADTNDYVESYSGTATIADGTNSVDFVFTPVDDLTYEGNQTIVLSITPNVAYGLLSPSSGTITITDNEEGTISSVTNGNWTNVSIWSSVVPDAQRTVSIEHDVTIDSVVDDINALTGSAIGNLFMDGGTLTVRNGGWNGLTAHSLSNGSTLTFNVYTRFQGAVTVDDSMLLFGSVVDFRGGTGVDMTIVNGATFTTPEIKFWDTNNDTIRIEGSGNGVTNGFNSIENTTQARTVNYEFVMDGTDVALSTFHYTTLDLTLGTGGGTPTTWNLVVDATKWSGAKTVFTLFDADTLAGTFNNVTFIGINPDDDVIIYDTDNGDIILDLTPEGLLFIVR